jgi:hypothetical protein
MAKNTELIDDNKKKVETTTSKVIAAIATVDSSLSKMVEMPKIIETLKETVESCKSDMSLGLKQFTAEIDESMNQLNAKYEARELELNAAIASKGETIIEAEKNNQRILEELKYNLNKNIERASIEAAITIGKQYNKSVVDTKELNELSKAATAIAKITDEERMTIIQGVTIDLEAKYSKELSELKHSTEKTIAINDSNLKHQLARITQLESEVTYYKTQIEKQRDGVKDLLSVSHNPVTVNTGDISSKK